MPTVGYADDVKKLGVSELGAFYRRFYAPNNAVLIVAGDAPTETVRKFAEKYYGPVPGRKVEPRRRPSEGGTDLPQRVVRADARVAEPRWNRDFLAPSYRMGESRHAHALQVLARLFGGSETSRLSRALVTESKIALSAGAGYGASSLGLTSFGLYVHPARGRGVGEIETATKAEMKRVLDGDVGAEEVERVQNQLLARDLFAGLASGPRLYGRVLPPAAHRRVDDWPQRIAAVRPERSWRRAPALARRGLGYLALRPADGWQ